MILNNYKTIQYISEQKENDLTIEKLFEIHKLVTENTLEEENIGKFRISNDVMVMNQITGEIVHTPPSYVEWLGIQAITNDNNEYLNEDKTIETSMLTPIGSAKYLRVRNFVTINEGTDEKLWINWI